MPASNRSDSLDRAHFHPTAHRRPVPPSHELATTTANRPTVIVPLRPGRERSEGTLGPSSVGRKTSLRQGRRSFSEGEALDEASPVTGMPSEHEGGADRIGLARSRQISTAASSTSRLSLSRTDTRLSTATAETSDAASLAAPAEPSPARAIPIRPRLDRRRSSTGAVTATPSAEQSRLLLVSTSLPARPRKQSSFASATAAPFSNLVALSDEDADTAVDRELRRAPPPPRPLRSVSTTVVHAAPPKVLKRKASVTTRGRYGGEPVEPVVVASRASRRPSTADAAVESSFPSPFVRPPPPAPSPYPSYSPPAWLPPSPAPVFATAPLDLASTASSSTEALPRTPSSCQRHSRGRSQGRARSKSKPKPRTESTSTLAASASETDSGAGSATATAGSSASASGSKTGTIRSGLLKLRKSTASLRNAFRPSRLDIPPLPAAPTSSSTSPAPLGSALPLSPIRTAATQPSLVSSVAGAAVDHAALALEPEPEPLSPTTPRASRRSGASARASENVPPVPALPAAAQQELHPTMASRAMSAKSAARRFPLYSFLARESPASLPTTPGAEPTAFAGASNPFAPTKASPEARSWTAPRYSLRRQKKLRREADALGLAADVLPPSPLAKSSPVASTSTSPSPDQTPAARLDPARRRLQSSPHVPATKVLDTLALDKFGPYAGRKGAAFKGKLWERKKEARVAHLAKLLEGADAKTAAWRKAQADAKNKSKASLPF
ncbi:hypothetical protein JCM3775_005257 [Rhodotorula graminis]